MAPSHRPVGLPLALKSGHPAPKNRTPQVFVPAPRNPHPVTPAPDPAVALLRRLAFSRRFACVGACLVAGWSVFAWMAYRALASARETLLAHASLREMPAAADALADQALLLAGAATFGAIVTVYLVFVLFQAIAQPLRETATTMRSRWQSGDPASGDPVDDIVAALDQAGTLLQKGADAVEAVANAVSADADAVSRFGAGIGLRSRSQVRAIATVSTATLAVDRHVRDVTRVLAEFERSAAGTDAAPASSETLAEALPPGRIGRVVEAIRTAAERTQLLSINAALEAARVGQSVRGFAVVADEVKRVAERTGSSTGEMTELAGHAFSSGRQSGGAGTAVENAPAGVETSRRRETASLPSSAARAHREAAAVITRNLESVTRDARANAEAADALDLAADAMRSQVVTLKTLARGLGKV